MSQAFLNGMRSVRGMGMGDVRQDYQRRDDQNNTVSGNPALANNIRAVRPTPGAQQVGAPRYLAPGNGMSTNQQLAAAQQQQNGGIASAAMNGMTGQPQFNGITNALGNVPTGDAVAAHNARIMQMQQQQPTMQPTPAGGQQMNMPVAPIQGPLPPGKNGMPMRANPQGGYPTPQYIQSFGQNNPNRRYLMK